MSYGIQFTYKNGEIEYYDPIQDFKTTDLNYEFWIGGHDYQIPIDNILELREYPLCEECGYELFDDSCENCKKD